MSKPNPQLELEILSVLSDGMQHSSHYIWQEARVERTYSRAQVVDALEALEGAGQVTRSGWSPVLWKLAGAL